jgi:hypothetical protein
VVRYALFLTERQQIVLLFGEHDIRFFGAAAVGQSVADVNYPVTLFLGFAYVETFAVAAESAAKFKIRKLRLNLIMIEKNQVIGAHLYQARESVIF